MQSYLRTSKQRPHMCNYRKSSLNWKSGQLFSLACHVVYTAMLSPITHHQPSARCKVEFVVCAKKGATKRFFKYAKMTYSSLPSSSAGQKVGSPLSSMCLMQRFDTWNSSTTWSLWLEQLEQPSDIVQHWMKSVSSLRFIDPPVGEVTRPGNFMGHEEMLNCVLFALQLDQVVRDIETLRKQGHDIAVEINIYVTS